jgi:hypothetical protein
MTAIRSAVLLWFALCSIYISQPHGQAAKEFQIYTSSYLGGDGDKDSIVGIRLQADGTIILAANLADDTPAVADAKVVGKGGGNGYILRLGRGGKEVVSVSRVAGEVRDMALDTAGNIYLATGDDGAMKMTPEADRAIWQVEMKGAKRIDAAADGHCAVIADAIVVLDPTGKPIGRSELKSFTNDVCIDSASKTVIFTGFRNARAFDGKKTHPVQICYLRGLSYDGQVKWTDYDWSTERDSDRFLNKPTNNMADSRGYRCSIGRDGKLYAAFEVAGGNHLFRYSSTDLSKKSPIVGGGNYHGFHNSKAEHKLFFARYEPATGEYLLGQQFCGRLSSGRANAVRVENGDIAADEAGRVYVTGVAASGLPLTLNPERTGDYMGGGYLLVMSQDFKERLFCTRLQGGGTYGHSVDARVLREKRITVVFGGGETKDEPLFTRDPLQAKGNAKDGFFAVIVDGEN